MRAINKEIQCRKGQEEMVGFALILIIVAVVFIVFISIYIRKPNEKVENYEVNSYVQAILQYTTTCQDEAAGFVNVQRLISRCQDQELCMFNRDPCVILNSTIRDVTKESWDVGPKNPIKGYTFIAIVSDGVDLPQRQFLNITEGTVNNLDSRSAEQDFGDPNGGSIVILFSAYG